MKNQSNNLDSIVNQIFVKEMQQKRVKKEIMSLKDLDALSYQISLQTTFQGLKVIIEVCEGALISKIPKVKLLRFPIIFEFLMDQNFPFNPPKIFAKTHFYKPSLADGRDFFHEIVQRNWNPAIPLIDIINLLPNFLKRIEELSKPEDSQSIGEFYLGTLYTLEDFINLENLSLFPGEEILSDHNGKVVERFFLIIESFFLNFEPVDKSKNIIRLVAWAHVQSIANAKKSKENTKKLVVTWINKSSKSGVVQNIYIVDNSQKLLEAIVHSSQKYGVKVSKGQQKRDLALSEVTIKNYEDMDIEELLDNITYLESQLDTQITIDGVNLLMTLYQKAIEYFSAFNDSAYQDFIMRLHGLLQREDVQVVLQSKEEDSKSQPQKSKESEKELENEDKKEHKKEEEKSNNLNQQESPFLVQNSESNQGEQEEEEEKKDENQVYNSEKIELANSSVARNNIEEPEHQENQQEEKNQKLEEIEDETSTNNDNEQKKEESN